MCRRPAAARRAHSGAPEYCELLRLVEDDTAALRGFQTGSHAPVARKVYALARRAAAINPVGIRDDGFDAHAPGLQRSLNRPSVWSRDRLIFSARLFFLRGCAGTFWRSADCKGRALAWVDPVGGPALLVFWVWQA